MKTFIYVPSVSSPLLLKNSPNPFAFIPLPAMSLSSLNRSNSNAFCHIMPYSAPVCKALHYSKTGVPWQMKSIFIIALYLHISLAFLLKCPILQGFSAFLYFCVSEISSQIFPYFLMLFPAILVNPLVNNRCVPTGVLGFRHSKQLCLCVIELHMGVDVQRHADVRMTHDILQCLWIHSGFRHIGTEGVSAYMRGYFGHLDAIDIVVFLNNVLQIFLPVQCDHRSVILV